MGKIFRDMTAEEQAYYDEDSKKFPWLKTITMSDDEFLACYERDLGKGMAAICFHSLWNKHYSWVCLAILKHFYETGEFVHYSSSIMIGIILMDRWKVLFRKSCRPGVQTCRPKMPFLTVRKSLTSASILFQQMYHPITG